ncbi:cytochrome-c oxidase, cbb3-type subunit III [Paraferrimonas sp. SM1919]|uniref:cytochrome-c oxidase, cbb3-type subunit III n=1 Tax=Paraferrimonas sp. SM1919 TaxID=2662263 RepID=UPI0013D6172A|nr:cytochrome-c oxidase, cbb3-type subunit III [Paraferrimonas sp. SM1919]
MNDIFNWLIPGISLGLIFACAVLLYFCSRNDTGVKEGESMGHTFDGIEEMNNGLPKWWSYMFVATIVFSLGYLALYPGLVSFGNALGWASSQHNTVTNHDGVREQDLDGAQFANVQYQQEVERADATYGPIFAKFAEKTVEELAQDPEAVKVGQRLFLQNCAQCHGSDAKGNKGFPNLTDEAWLYGGDAATIKASIMNGRRGMMPPKGGLPITDEEIPGLVEHVLNLSGRAGVDQELAAKGQMSFMKGCFACHGMDAKGNKFMGAPNLTDTAWVFGGSREDIAYSIKNGRAGVMPAWKEVLGEDKVHVISAYVYSLSAQ